MSFHLYKEGQGTWARGSLAAVVGFTGLVAAITVYDLLDTAQWAQGGITIPGIDWTIGVNVIGAALMLIPFGVGGIWLYNYKPWADFLIETESELRNKVTWPSRKDVINNSIVVVIVTVILGAWIFGVDALFRVVSDAIYGLGGV